MIRERRVARTIEERSFDLPAQARIENAVERGRIWLNGQEIVSPKAFGQQVSVIERTVTLAPENELQVRLGGTPGGRIAVVIEPASWSP